MSKINIKGLIKNTRERTNAYTPIIEGIVNSIQAIEDSKRSDGVIVISIERDNQTALPFDGGALSEISSIKIQDNGIGFDQDNRDSFDMVYSQLKVKKGGKGFGRFMFLKYFESVGIESVYHDNGRYFLRSFDFGSDEEIIENENINDSDEIDTKTILHLKNIRESSFEKKLETLARILLEKLLVYFIREEYVCPKIILKEANDSKMIVLNEYLARDDYAEIQEIGSKDFKFQVGNDSENFKVKVFKIFYPANSISKISLTAHHREVVEATLHDYIPEFAEDFYEEFESSNGKVISKNYKIKTYVIGNYLDSNVSLERGDFSFPTKNDLLNSISQDMIANKAAEITKEFFEEEVKTRKDKKLKRIKQYIEDEAPWHKAYLDDLDVSLIPYKFTDETIELELHKTKFNQERNAKAEVKKLLDNPNVGLDESVEKLMSKISKAEVGELAHYVALRKIILSLFKKSLEVKEDGNYSSENVVHSIIFPTRSDSNSTLYHNHNLWIIDEKLTFTEYVSSDKPLNGGVSPRPDLLVFNKRMAFRGGEEASNPITIFEFKKPQRDDFTNPSSEEDPVQQIVRYVNDIKDGKYKTPQGRDILVGENTPFYGIIVCDLTKKVTGWLLREKDFKVMPDGKGYFQWFSNNNLYIEVISWDKLLKDAEMRHKIFFHKLAIDN